MDLPQEVINKILSFRGPTETAKIMNRLLDENGFNLTWKIYEGNLLLIPLLSAFPVEIARLYCLAIGEVRLDLMEHLLLKLPMYLDRPFPPEFEGYYGSTPDMRIKDYVSNYPLVEHLDIMEKLEAFDLQSLQMIVFSVYQHDIVESFLWLHSRNYFAVTDLYASHIFLAAIRCKSHTIIKHALQLYSCQLVPLCEMHFSENHGRISHLLNRSDGHCYMCTMPSMPPMPLTKKS